MHSYNICNCSLISTLNVCDLGKEQKFSRNNFTCPFKTLGFVLRMKWSVITLFGRVMNNNVELCSDWLFYSSAHFSSSHSKQICTVREWWSEESNLKCLSLYQAKIQILRDFARMFSSCGMNMIAPRCWWRERGLREDAAPALPDPPVIGVFGLVFSLILTL